MMRKALILIVAVLLSACGTTSSYSDAPRVREYAPRYAAYEFNLASQYRVSHEYFAVGKEDDPIRAVCMYGSYNDTIGDMFEKNGHIFQMGYSNRSVAPIAYNMDRFVLGIPRTSKLTARYNEQAKKWEGGSPYVDFTPFCSDRVGAYAFIVSLRKSSAQSIEDGIQTQISICQKVWKSARWDAPITIQRGPNQWTVFRIWNPLDYLADASEEWSLPIGNGEYYYRVVFSYQSDEVKNNPNQYSQARAVFDHILDSFKIEPLKAQ